MLKYPKHTINKSHTTNVCDFCMRVTVHRSTQKNAL